MNLHKFAEHFLTYRSIWRGGRAWLIAPVLKTGKGKLFGGSNPSPSAKMKKIILITLFFSFAFGQGQNSLLKEVFLQNSSLERFLAISDGPYIFIEKNKLIEKQIVNGMVFTKTLKQAHSTQRTHLKSQLLII